MKESGRKVVENVRERKKEKKKKIDTKRVSYYRMIEMNLAMYKSDGCC